MYRVATSSLSPERTANPCVVTWHVSDVTNLIISTESVKACRTSKCDLRLCGSSLIMDRSDTRDERGLVQVREGAMAEAVLRLTP